MRRCKRWSCRITIQEQVKAGADLPRPHRLLEERGLLYVAMIRACYELVVVRAGTATKWT